MAYGSERQDLNSSLSYSKVYTLNYYLIWPPACSLYQYNQFHPVNAQRVHELDLGKELCILF